MSETLLNRIFSFAGVRSKAFSNIVDARIPLHTGFGIARWIFLRALAGIYAVAFLSLFSQMDGLVGERGLLPVGLAQGALYQQYGAAAYYFFPSLTWLGSGDGMLTLLTLGGFFASLFAFAGILSGPVFLLLWVFYLSLTTAGQDFMSFQWDVLLLEAGFLAIVFTPWRLLEFFPFGKIFNSPAPALLRLYRLLFFKLIFMSGAVKLMSGDPAWRDFSALRYHYHTQPLPNPVSWLIDKAPAWFHGLSVAELFLIELAAPFFFFAPRRLRFIAVGLVVFIQLLIFATGNYTFFNLLTIALAVLLFDDAFWHRLASRFRPLPELFSNPYRKGPATSFVLTFAGCIFFLNALVFLMFFGGYSRLPAPAQGIVATIQPLRIVNHYGLFAVMTVTRPEIVLEGSEDGIEWKEYEFRYKPGDIKKMPAFVAPFQPRLDWQMWFAALSPYRDNAWFINLVARTLQGEPATTRFFARNPFPVKPPRYVRAQLYEYTFSSWLEFADGNWWHREPIGIYMPPISLAASRQ